jgi:FKBP-type peptidyl-prolyl cis-trans isomerase
MFRPSSIVATTLTATVLLLGSAVAQTAPAAKPKAPAAAKAAPAAKAETPEKATQSTTPGNTSLTTQKEKASYAIGMSIGSGMRKDGVDVDPKLLQQGIMDALAGNKPLISEEEARTAIMNLQMELRGKQEAKMKEAGDSNQKEGDAFLAANKGKEGVVTLPSGLQYKVLTAGTGPKPAATDQVTVNYRGTLISGKEFDSSYKRGQPATFPVSGVIKGWTEALQLMPVGSKWQLFIPPQLAYGARGAGADIGPNATLVFDVELLSIKGSEKPATPPTEEKK